MEIARNRPQANELAMPRTLGLSRHEVQIVGIQPAMAPSRKAKIMKEIWSQRMPLDFESSSSSDEEYWETGLLFS